MCSAKRMLDTIKLSHVIFINGSLFSTQTDLCQRVLFWSECGSLYQPIDKREVVHFAGRGILDWVRHFAGQSKNFSIFSVRILQQSDRYRSCAAFRAAAGLDFIFSMMTRDLTSTNKAFRTEMDQVYS